MCKKRLSLKLLLSFFIALTASTAFSISMPNDIRFLKPAMGWSSWNAFGCSRNMTEGNVMKVATYMHNNGIQSAGYTYINLDDCTFGKRDSNARLTLKKSFSKQNNISYLATFIHHYGLKFGVYTAAGQYTCDENTDSSYRNSAGAIGIDGHSIDDINNFASWGVDYLKLDKCTAAPWKFLPVRKAILGISKKILLSYNPEDHGDSDTAFSLLGETARVYADFKPITGFSGLYAQINNANSVIAEAIPGYHNDLDILNIGDWLSSDTKSNYILSKAQLVTWAMMSSPMLLGYDFANKKMSTNDLALIKNKYITAIDQDDLSIQSKQIHNNNYILFYKPLEKPGTFAIEVFFGENNPGVPVVLGKDIPWTTFGVSNPNGMNIYDAFLHTNTILKNNNPYFSVSSRNTPKGEVKLFIVSNAKEFTGPWNGKSTISRDNKYSLTSIKPIYKTSGWGSVHINKSVGGNDFSVDHDNVGGLGIGTHAPSQVLYRINGECSKIDVKVGLDSEDLGNQPSQVQVRFEIWGDNKLLGYKTIQGDQREVPLSANLTGSSNLRLVVRPMTYHPTRGTGLPDIYFEHADWINPIVTCLSHNTPK